MIIILIIVFAAILCYEINQGNLTIDNHYLLIAVVGIAALIIPLILSISSKYNIGSKLDSGEVRKSIVISLTIIYIIFLVMSLDQTLHEQPPATNGTYLLNATYDENRTDTHKNITININSVPEGVLQVIPVTATANVSNGTVQITPHVSNKTGAGDGGAGTIPLTSDNGTSLPTDAINSFTKNFLWVYALIISFYFGSRIWEDRADKSTFSGYISDVMKNEKRLLDPLDIAKARFSLGDIGQREFIKLKQCLEENSKVMIEDAFFKKYEKGKGVKNGLIILRIRNDSLKDIKVKEVIIDKGDDEAAHIIDDITINRKDKRTIIAKHNIGNKENIKSIKIKIDDRVPDGEYSDPIMKDQIKGIKEIKEN